MTTVKSFPPSCSTAMFKCRQSPTFPENLGFSMLSGINAARSCRSRKSLVLFYDGSRSKEYTDAFLINDCFRKFSRNSLKPIKAKNDSESSCTDNSAAFSGNFFFFLILSFQILFFSTGLKSYQDLVMDSGISCFFALYLYFVFVCNVIRISISTSFIIIYTVVRLCLVECIQKESRTF
jgi:hypothetical protein